jgi:hypothetical protein
MVDAPGTIMTSADEDEAGSGLGSGVPIGNSIGVHFQPKLLYKHAHAHIAVSCIKRSTQTHLYKRIQHGAGSNQFSPVL